MALHVSIASPEFPTTNWYDPALLGMGENDIAFAEAFVADEGLK
ncbi:hypothetical protein [Aridibaculum aurantiacum]|nr:hypothetical protein [Aridibaculum aurantiacum]